MEADKKIIGELLEYIIWGMHWCPFRDDAEIDFEGECVGFRREGCKECILGHIGELNKGVRPEGLKRLLEESE